MSDERPRRAVLACGSALVAGLAGCGSTGTTADSDGPTATGGGSPSPAQDRDTTTSGGSEPRTMTTDDLDLREANVTEVAIEDRGDGRYRFDVTLYHDDDGEDGYANWWQVETLDGEQLGRRKLLHAHSTAPFTRSETITIPGGVDCVVVRGHDQTHGYGGQAMLVDVASGASRAVRQGPDREAVSASDCP